MIELSIEIGEIQNRIKEMKDQIRYIELIE